MVARKWLLAAAAAACALSFCVPGQALASGTQESILMDDAQLIYSSPSHVVRTLQELRALGVDRVKASVVWSLVAPAATSSHRPQFDATDPAAYPPGAWNRYDVLVRAAETLGLKLYFEFTPPTPTWALAKLPHGQGLRLGQAPSNSEFAQFVEAVGRRYSGSYTVPLNQIDPSVGMNLPITIPGLSGGSGSDPTTTPAPPLPRVDYWGIWNEPNFPSWLNPWYRRLPDGRRQMTQPSLYRGLMNAAWSGLHASGHAGDTILIGETANFGNVEPVPFVEDLYCVGSSFQPLRGRAATAVGCPVSGNRASFVVANPGLFEVTGYAHHPYGFDVPPNRPYMYPAWVTLYNISWLERVLNKSFAAYGRHPPGGVPLYLTEWGYKTNPPNPYVKTSLSQQAAWLDEGEYMTWQDSYVRALAQFLLVDDGPRTSEPVGSRLYWHNFQTGLLTIDGKPKPSLSAFRIPIWVPSARHGSHVTVWGQLRPADHAGLQYGVFEFRRKGRGSFSPLREVQTASPEGFILAYLNIPAAGTLRLGWLDSSTGTLYYSRTVSIS